MKIPRTEFLNSQDLIIQVLKELPVKSLLRFRCVSKYWLSIIDDPFFIDLHRARSHSRSGGVSLLVHAKREASSDFYSLRLEPRSEPRLVYTDHSEDQSLFFSSVEGLVCYDNQIWNPSTRKRIDLPPVPIPCNNRKTYTTELSIQPRYFLGFNPLTKEYKVLSICRVKEEIRKEKRKYCVTKVLTLGTNTWRNVDALHYDQLVLHFDSITSCCVNNVLYIYKNSTGLLIAFDLATEQSRIIPFPKSGIWVDVCHPQDVGGNLGILNYRWQKIMVLEDENSGRWEAGKMSLNTSWTTMHPRYFRHNPFCIHFEIHGLGELLNGCYYYYSKQVETLFRMSQAEDL